MCLEYAWSQVVREARLEHQKLILQRSTTIKILTTHETALK